MVAIVFVLQQERNHLFVVVEIESLADVRVCYDAVFDSVVACSLTLTPDHDVVSHYNHWPFAGFGMQLREERVRLADVAGHEDEAPVADWLGCEL